MPIRAGRVVGTNRVGSVPVESDRIHCCNLLVHAPLGHCVAQGLERTHAVVPGVVQALHVLVPARHVYVVCTTPQPACAKGTNLTQRMKCKCNSPTWDRIQSSPCTPRRGPPCTLILGTASQSYTLCSLPTHCPGPCSKSKDMVTNLKKIRGAFPTWSWNHPPACTGPWICQGSRVCKSGAAPGNPGHHPQEAGLHNHPLHRAARPSIPCCCIECCT